MKAFIAGLLFAAVSAKHGHKESTKETWTAARINDETWGLQFELTKEEREVYAACLTQRQSKLEEVVAAIDECKTSVKAITEI